MGTQSLLHNPNIQDSYLLKFLNLWWRLKHFLQICHFHLIVFIFTQFLISIDINHDTRQVENQLVHKDAGVRTSDIILLQVTWSAKYQVDCIILYTFHSSFHNSNAQHVPPNQYLKLSNISWKVSQYSVTVGFDRIQNVFVMPFFWCLNGLCSTEWSNKCCRLDRHL